MRPRDRLDTKVPTRVTIPIRLSANPNAPPFAHIPIQQNSTASNSSLQQQASHWPPVGDRIQHSETPISHNHTPSAGIATGTISPLEPMLEVATQATPFTYTRFSTAVDLIYSIPSALSVAPVMAPKPELYLKAVRHEMCQERPLGGKACD
ncbi:hypothetical protein VE01_04997 [Pseudogymnoascus verrucosus]|uniref:Uncharacterized protein n=1 Tax=Pseudogymnoascus verrucosus TaxID=342668 RepID=A0A1B8GPG9_9PEZI|nr:uncharacterized protein VE01_04997 [Pseudogymnoascus verrucosus]OBT97739.1 hypothetical protein VE01_04997 [Pseudogymnoascus verrucosus]